MINTEYDDLENVSVIVGSAMAEWKDDDIKTIRIFDVKPMSSDDAARYGKYMRECLVSTTNINADLLSIMLHLAVSIKDPNKVENNILKQPKRTADVLLPLPLPELTKASEQLTQDERDILIGLGANVADRIEAAADAIERDEEQTVGEEEEDEANGESLVDQAAAYTYLAAFLMRLQCKQIPNVQNNYVKAMSRFKGWYDKGEAVFDGFVIPVDSLNKIKDVIARKTEIVGTWVMWLAEAENKQNDLLTQTNGLLDYLGIQIFSYQGMHALTQVLAIHQISKLALRDLLKELDCPLTRSGVREIEKIIRNHEITSTNPERKTYFRYARVWDKKYFSMIQSKACAPLLYVAALTVKNISQNTWSDPTQIFAVQSLGEGLKTRLNVASGKLVEIIMAKTTVDERSGEMCEWCCRGRCKKQEHRYRMISKRRCGGIWRRRRLSL